MHIPLCITTFALALCKIADADRLQSLGPELVLFRAPAQVLESRKENGVQQNLGQGLLVFKCTIGALTEVQGEVTEMVCRLLKHLKKRKIYLYEQGDLFLKLLQTNKTSKSLP